MAGGSPRQGPIVAPLIVESEAGPLELDCGGKPGGAECEGNSKSEIRSTKQYRNSNDRNIGTAVLNIGDSCFEFVSNLEIRYSDLSRRGVAPAALCFADHPAPRRRAVLPGAGPVGWTKVGDRSRQVARKARGRGKILVFLSDAGILAKTLMNVGLLPPGGGVVGGEEGTAGATS